jgi:hypothetical protein
MEDPLKRLEVLETQRATLLKERDRILSDLRATHRYQGGRRLSGSEFLKWRGGVQRQDAKNIAELREVNTEIKSLRRLRNERVVAAMGLDVRDPDSLIAHAFNLLHRLASEGVDLDPQEQATVDGLRHYLAHVPAKGGG